MYRRVLRLEHHGIESRLIVTDYSGGKMYAMGIYDGANDYSVVYAHIDKILGCGRDVPLFVLGADRKEIKIEYKKRGDAMPRAILLEIVPQE